MTPAPIALFAYRRPDHTRRCLEALRANPEAARSELHVFSDGPKNAEAEAGVAAVRALLSDVPGFARVTVTARPANLGLARSIISGVTDIVGRHGRVIVVEDDLVTSPHFLAYMNGALDLYRDSEEVASIHGYIYPVKTALPATFFLKGADCWGWATWKRAWDHFNPDGTDLLAKLRSRGLTRAFDRNGTYPYTRMLEDQIAGRNDSWAVRWHASVFLAGRYTLYPGRSLVHNIGNDAQGTHSEATEIFDVNLADAPVDLRAIPVREEPAAAGAVEAFFSSMRPTLAGRIKRGIKSLLPGAARR